jgi:hypothetical protein
MLFLGKRVTMRKLLFTAVTVGAIVAPYTAFACKIIGNG